MTKKGLKKRISMAMAVAMAMTVMVMPVSAADDTVNVQYTEKPTYTMSIPSKVVNLSETEEKTAVVGVTDLKLGTNQHVVIKVSNSIYTTLKDGNVVLTDTYISKGQTVTSKVSLTPNNSGDGINLDTIVGDFANDSGSFSSTLYFSPLGDVVPGDYSGKLMFSSQLLLK